MKPALLHLIPCVLATLSAFAFGDAAIEGRVELPKGHSAPVVAKRYEIVTKGGVVATDPPMAVVYLEGPFARPASPPTAQMAQMAQMDQPAVFP